MGLRCGEWTTERTSKDPNIPVLFPSQSVEVRYGISRRLKLNEGDGHHLLEMFQPVEKS